jgi:tetratricopeptide (TPR) repeat protein
MKKLVFFFCFTLITAILSGQDYETVRNAFAQSYAHEKEGEYKKAIDDLKAVYSEDSFPINIRLGWLSYMGGFFTESIAYYQKSINLKPLALDAKFGFVYPTSAMGNWESVKKQYKDILAIDPQNTIANYRMGSIHYGNEEYETALKYFEKVVNLYPFDYDALVMYAWTHLQLGKYREAEVLFNQALMNQPDGQSAQEGLEALGD